MPDDTVTVSYTLPRPSSKNWVGIYPENVTPNSRPSATWTYTSGESGTVTFGTGSLAPGGYKAYVFANDGYEQLSGPTFFWVSGETAAPAPDNGLGRTPQMGWNTWNAYRCDINEDKVKAAADAIADKNNGLLKNAGYQYINIDDCWQASSRDQEGRLQPNPDRFPSGIAKLADYAHSKGLKLGIYANPGTRTCANIWDGYPGRNGSLGHEALDAQTFASWGVDYLKYDWCNAHEDGVDPQQAFTTMRDALAATKRPIFYSIHREPQLPIDDWRPKVANSWRTTHDIVNANTKKSWSSMIEIVHKNRDLARYARPGAWNDPDMLDIGNCRMNDIESRTHFSLWAEMAAPLIMGNGLSDANPECKPSPETLKILGNADVIAVDQDPLGKQGTVVSDEEHLVVMSKELENGDRAVTLTNEGASAQTISTTMAGLGIGGRSSYTLKNLWSGQTTTSSSGTVSASVPPHGTVMYRVAPSGSNGNNVPGSIEAEAPGNTIAGAAAISSCPECSGSGEVRWIGNGAANFITLNAGANNIRFHNDTAYAPDLDKITVG